MATLSNSEEAVADSVSMSREVGEEETYTFTIELIL